MRTKDFLTYIKNKNMEFKEYGPLAQSKATAENKTMSWVPLVLMLGLGAIMGITWVNMIRESQPWNKISIEI